MMGTAPAASARWAAAAAAATAIVLGYPDEGLGEWLSDVR